MELTRRDALLRFLFGTGYLGLRSLATGIPIGILANPRRALALGAAAFNPGPAQFLIMSASGNGDPVDCNVPGTYEDPKVLHPADPAMAPATLRLGANSYQAAKVWTSLPGTALERISFFHQATKTGVHPDQPNVMKLMGAVAKDDMLCSFMAKNLAPVLGTVQAQPICLGAYGGGESLSFGGTPLPMLSPTVLGSVLSSPSGPLANLQAMRDADLVALNAFFKAQGNNAQGTFVDQYAQSQEELRSISQNLISALSSITSNGPGGQVQAAVIMAQMKLAPVFTVHLPFGEDNHFDTGLLQETSEHISSMATINDMLSRLSAAGLSDKVTFATLNVFGRTKAIAHKGDAGRDHNGNHHCGIMIGKNVAPSVIGGIQPYAGDYGALPIESSSGMGSVSGDIAMGDTMASYGMTLSAAVGLPADLINQNIISSTGKIVNAALVSA